MKVRIIVNGEGRRVFAAQPSNQGTAFCSAQIERGSWVPYKELKSRLSLIIQQKGGAR